MSNTPDPTQKETEAGWIGIVRQFVTKAAPVWFQWLEWLLILGVIHYLAEQTHNTLLELVRAISHMVLWFYFSSMFFVRMESWEFRWIRSDFIREMASLWAATILSGTLGVVLWSFFIDLASEIQGKV